MKKLIYILILLVFWNCQNTHSTELNKKLKLAHQESLQQLEIFYVDYKFDYL